MDDNTHIVYETVHLRVYCTVQDYPTKNSKPFRQLFGWMLRRFKCVPIFLLNSHAYSRGKCTKIINLWFSNIFSPWLGDGQKVYARFDFSLNTAYCIQVYALEALYTLLPYIKTAQRAKFILRAILILKKHDLYSVPGVAKSILYH